MNILLLKAMLIIVGNLLYNGVGILRKCLSIAYEEDLKNNGCICYY